MVKLQSRVEKILTKNQSAKGVRTEDGKEYRSRVVISNANAMDTFTKIRIHYGYMKMFRTVPKIVFQEGLARE